ncbi:family 1 glycosylhydrolase [Paenibacillus albidus]|nr:family 1 glycosylhydrolase [Paenibacillus albidus]
MRRGFKAYRFSIAWTRIYPNGDGEVKFINTHTCSGGIPGGVGVLLFITLNWISMQIPALLLR